MKSRRVEGKKVRRLKASIPLLQTNSNDLYNIRHFDVFAADSVHLKKPSGGPKGLIGPPCHGAAGGNLYLTDTLENQEISNIPIGVILCNPPYSVHSLNKGEWILKLVKDYLQVKGMRIKEKNIKGLQDDYVKFFRFAQWKIDQKGSGIMGFITSSSYLENPTFRGMRYSLLKSFDEIYILDLHGAAGRVGKKDDDENVFGIGRGIAISFLVKLKRSRKIRENFEILDCKVYYSSLKGSKAVKLKSLEILKENNYKAVNWKRLFPAGPEHCFLSRLSRQLSKRLSSLMHVLWIPRPLALSQRSLTRRPFQDKGSEKARR